MTREWWQVVHGKVVDPQGVVLSSGSGSEHGCTGLSKDIPPGLKDCSPNRIGIGADDLTDWEAAPWFREGSLIVRPVEADGRWYVVAGRVRSRSEGGEGAASRKYTQAYYLIQEAEANPVEALPGLLPRLKAEPMTTIDHELPKVVAPSGADFKVPREWPAQVRPYLEALLSGLPVADTTRTLTPDGFAQLALLCLACLPGTLRWRISFGAGLYHIGPDEVALGHGLYARGGIHKTDGKWHGRDEEKLQRGREYVRWLEESAPAVETLSQLRDWVDEHLPELSRWDALAPRLAWKEAVAGLPEHLAEARALTELRHWLAGRPGAACPDFAVFQRLRTPALLTVLVYLKKEERGRELLDRVADPAWKPTWEAAAAVPGDPMVHALPMLLGLAPLQVTELKYALPVQVPDTLHERIAGVLNGALHAEDLETQLRSWADVIRNSRGSRPPEWLRHWRKGAGTREALLWLGCHIDLRWPEEDCLASWARDADVRALRTLLAGHGRPNPDSFQKLLETIAPLRTAPPAAKQGVFLLCKTAWEHRRYAEAILIQAELEALGERTDWSAGLRPEKLTDPKYQDVVVQAAREGERYGWPDPLLEVVLILWHRLPEKIQKEVGGAIPERIGASLTEVLCGLPGGAEESGPRKELAQGLLLSAMTVSEEVVLRMRKRCAEATARDPLLDTLRAWVVQTTPERLQKFPELAFVHDLRTNPREETRVPELSLDEARFVGRLLENEEEPRSLRLPQHGAAVGHLRAYLAAVNPRQVAANSGRDLPSYQDHAFVVTLKAVLKNEHERDFWDEVLGKLNLAGLEGWRLLRVHQPARRLAPDEEQLLGWLNTIERLQLLLSGWPLRGTALPVPSVDALWEAGLQGGLKDYPKVRRLVTVAREAKATRLSVALVQHITRVLSESQYPVSLRDLERALSVRWWHFWRRPHPNPWVRLAYEALGAAGRNRPPLKEILEGARPRYGAVRSFQGPLPTRSASEDWPRWRFGLGGAFRPISPAGRRGRRHAAPYRAGR